MRGLLLFVCLCLVGGLFWGILQIDFNLQDTRVQQGAIAAAVVAAGWLVTFGFREVSVWIERKERSRDILVAISAEIYDYSEAISLDDASAWVAKVTEDVRQGGDSEEDAFYPFISKISEPVIFNKLVEQVHLLPEESIDTTIQFYSMLSDLRLFVEDLRSEDFCKISAERRLIGYVDLIDMRMTTVDIAKEALRVLDAARAGYPSWLVRHDGTAPL